MVRVNKLTQLEGPQEFGEFGRSGDSDKISPKLLTKLYVCLVMSWLEGTKRADEFGENGKFGETSRVELTVLVSKRPYKLKPLTCNRVYKY